MAQRIDWKNMPHAELVQALQEGSEVRDERVRELMDADKPNRRKASAKNGANEQPEAS